MDKKEFLDVLRQALSGEVDPEMIDQNIRYYDQYIGAGALEEEARRLSELGDPRLIARTIIEADRVAKQKVKFQSSQSNYTNTYAEDETENNNKRSSDRGSNVFYTNLKWYHKIMIAFIILVVIILIIFVGRLIIGFLFAFGLPILLVLLLLTLFRKR